MNEGREKSIHEEFRNYRKSGIGLSATLTTLSSALILWLSHIMTEALAKGNYTSAILSAICFLFCGATIVFSLCIQFFDYQGYKHQARASLPERQSTFKDANDWFDKEDFSTYAAVIAFICTIILSAIVFCSSLCPIISAN